MKKLLINNPDLKKLSSSELEFLEFNDYSSDSTDAAAVVIEGEQYEEELNQAIDLNIPVLVIAGNIETSNKDVALQLGYPKEAVIVKEGSIIHNLAGIEFTQDSKGIKLKDMIKMCKYVYDNDFKPACYIWVDPSHKQTEPDIAVWEAPNNTIENSLAKTQSNSHSKPEIIDLGSTKANKKETNPSIVRKTIEALVSEHQEVITVFKTVPDAKTSNIVKNIAEQKKALHLEITKEGNSYRWYSDDKNKVLLSGLYASSKDGVNCEISSSYMSYNTVVVEIDPSFIDMNILNDIYSKSAKTIHIPGSFKDSENALDMWIEGGFRLDGIIIDQDDKQYLNKYGKLVKTIDQIL